MTFRIRTLPFIALATAVLLLPSLVDAQERRPTISVGDHVRLYSADADTLRAEGRVAQLEPGRILLAGDDGRAALSTPLVWNDLLAVRRIDPVGRNVRRRSLWGLFLGGSAGGIAAPFVGGSDDSTDPAGRTVLVGVGAGAVIGAGIGALVGYLLPGHHWEYVRVEYELTGIPRTGS